MRLADIIKSNKEALSHGAWGDEKIRMKDFPLSKRRGRVYPLTRRWRWRVSTFEIGVRKFRILCAYHLLVPEFTTVLAEDVAGDSRVIARLEFHGSHTGWHVHPFCAEISAATEGMTKPFGMKRIPGKDAFHRHCEMLIKGRKMNDVTASAVAASFFRLPDETDLFAFEGLPWKT